jgi:hypothetical protein
VSVTGSRSIVCERNLGVGVFRDCVSSDPRNLDAVGDLQRLIPGAKTAILTLQTFT